MHELPVTQSLLEIALRHAQQSDAQRILSLNIVLGQFATIVDDSVQFYWDLIAQDTIAAGARLNFRRVPAELLCLECDQRYIPGPEELDCPACHSTNVKIISGKEFFLESIDVE
jgi:hydrogenase nickel incorporation protein HypA/HybF